MLTYKQRKDPSCSMGDLQDPIRGATATVPYFFWPNEFWGDSPKMAKKIII